MWYVHATGIQCAELSMCVHLYILVVDSRTKSGPFAHLYHRDSALHSGCHGVCTTGTLFSRPGTVTVTGSSLSEHSKLSRKTFELEVRVFALALSATHSTVTPVGSVGKRPDSERLQKPATKPGGTRAPPYYHSKVGGRGCD